MIAFARPPKNAFGVNSNRLRRVRSIVIATSPRGQGNKAFSTSQRLSLSLGIPASRIVVLTVALHLSTLRDSESDANMATTFPGISIASYQIADTHPVIWRSHASCVTWQRASFSITTRLSWWQPGSPRSGRLVYELAEKKTLTPPPSWLRRFLAAAATPVN